MQNELKIYYPFKPYIITQAWGKENPMYQQLGFTHHNGIDAFTGKYDWQGKVVSEYPVYCPVEGFTVDRVSYDPNGGGNQIFLISDEPLQMFDRKVYARICLLHGKKILVPEGYKPKLGELLMIADNTGFSTGIHTHMGLYRLDNGSPVDHNDATNSFDPMLFFTKQYAVDVADTATLIKSGLRYLQYQLGL